MDKNTEFYYKSAQKYFLPVEPIDEIAGFVLKLAKKNYYFRVRDTPFNNYSSTGIALNKYCTNKLLEKNNVPVPKATALSFEEYQQGLLDQFLTGMQYPLVLKPTMSGLGKDVLCNIKTPLQLKKHMDAMFPVYEFLTIEEFHGQLKSYRVLLFKKRIMGIIFREPAHVFGDGLHSIVQLIALTNEKRAKENDALAPVVVDEECQIRLEEQGLSLEDIPKNKEKIILGYTSNASRGGTFIALKNDRICKENHQLMIRICDLLNLNLVGIDIECEDIGKPLASSKGVILEVNHSPSIKIHENPLKGPANPVAKKIIRELIFRHPFAWLRVLFNHKKTAMYVRFFVLFIFLILFYRLLYLYL